MSRNVQSLLFAMGLLIAGSAMFGGLSASAFAAQTTAELPEGVFAVVDGEEVSTQDFQLFMAQYARSKFYHGTDQENLESIREEAARALIDQRLLVHEADRRGLAGDSEAVEKQIAGYKDRYGASESWPEIEKQLPLIRTRLLEQSKVAELEEAVRRVEDPDETALRTFYNENQNLFTEPEKMRLSVILLNVAPWEGPDVWEETKAKAESISGELAGGASFAELAQQHSTHSSAAEGGDLGLIHDGMLSEPAQEAVDALGDQGVTPPVRLLEGYGLFKLNGLQPPQLHSFEDVRERALGLYQRQMNDRQWQRFIDDLREKASVVVDSTP